MEITQRNEKGQFNKGITHDRKWKPVVGTIFGSLKVISDKIEYTSDNKVKYNVQCNCGKELFVRAYFLENGRQKYCRECSQRNAVYTHDNRANFLNKTHSGYKNITKTVYSYLKRNAIRRDITWDSNITIEFLWDLYIKQNGLCALSGFPIQFTEKRKMSNINWDFMTASLDRIDSSKPYSVENIQWVHKHVNKMKNNFDQTYFIDLCKNIYLYTNGNTEPSFTRSCEEGAETSG